MPDRSGRCARRIAVVVAILAPGPRGALGQERCARPLSGRILDADLGTPIAGVSVRAQDQTTTTDENGRFRLRGLCDGSTVVTLVEPRYAPLSRVVELPHPAPLSLKLVYRMTSVVVRPPPPLDDLTLGPEETLEGAALEARRGLTLGSALEGVPGVRVLRSGTVSKPVIDGFSGNRVLILNDGVRHHAQLWGLDHAPEIDPFGAARVRIVRGAAGVRFGADALGGAVIVEPPAFRDIPGIEGEAHFVGISNGYQGASSLSVRGTVPGAREIAWRLQGSFKKAGSLETPDYDLDNTAVEEQNVSGAVAYRGRRLFASLGISRFSNRNGVFTGLRSESPTDFFRAIESDQPLGVDLYEFSYEIERAFQDVEHWFVRGELSYAFEDLGTLRALYGFQNNDRREFDSVRRSVTGPQLALELATHTLEVTLEHPVTRHLSVTFGAAGRYQHNDHGGRRLMPDYDLWGGGVFALGRYAQDGFELEAGVRYEVLTADTVEPARIAPNQNPPIRRQLDFQATSATLAGRFSILPTLTLELQLAHAARVPTMNELFIDGPSQGQGTFETGDPTLGVERTYNVSGGVAYASGWVSAEVTAYAHFIDDFIYYAPRLGPDGTPETELTVSGAFPAFEYRAVDALYRGANLTLTLRPWRFVELRTQASLVRARNRSDDAFLVLIPPDRIENRVTFRTPDAGPLSRVSLWAESTVTLEQRRVDPNADFTDPPDTYHLLGAGVTGLIDVLGQPVGISLEVQNLLDARYRDYLSRLRYFADEPGRSTTLRIRIPFDVNWSEQPEERYIACTRFD